MYARGALHSWGRGGVRDGGRNPLDVVCIDDFRALSRKVEAIQEEIRIGFSRKRKDEGEEDKTVEGANNEMHVEDEPIAIALNDPLVRTLTRMGKRLKTYVPTFNENLNPKQVIDWINDMEEYFEFEEVEDPDRVRFKNTKLMLATMQQTERWG
ncbi:hypothetical protein SUGI_0268280 [Cryptomeria japonica]|nr:hypothetical protein SUGI_0268280 [Cryptomeria japonica]